MAKLPEFFHFQVLSGLTKIEIRDVSDKDFVEVVRCRDCKHNNACLTQAFVEDASRVPFDRNTFFCADGRRADDA